MRMKVTLDHHFLLRFDVDLTSAKDDSNSEVQARERLAREKNALQAEYNELKEKAKVCLFLSHVLPLTATIRVFKRFIPLLFLWMHEIYPCTMNLHKWKEF